MFSGHDIADQIAKDEKRARDEKKKKREENKKKVELVLDERSLSSTEEIKDSRVPVTPHLLTQAEWDGLSAKSRANVERMEKRLTEQLAECTASDLENFSLNFRLTTLAELWRNRPAGISEYASHYGNGDWVDAFERAMGVEK